jgi:hypothetical protein
VEDCLETLLENAQFALDASAWTAASGTIEHASVDANDSGSSGSLSVTTESADGGTHRAFATQCVAIDDGALQSVFAESFEASAQGTVGAFIGVRYFGSADCVDPFDADAGGLTRTVVIDTADAWVTHSIVDRSPPPGAVSMLVLLGVASDGAGGSVQFDDILLTERSQGPCIGLDSSIDLNDDEVPDCEQNLLSNGQFPWHVAGYYRGSNLDTAHSSPTTPAENGYLISYYTPPGTGAFSGGTFTCVPATPDATYSAYARGFQPLGQSGTLALSVQVAFYDDADCTSSLSGEVVNGSANDTQDAWVVVAAENALAPAAAVSVRVRPTTRTSGTTATIEMHFDDVLLIEEP